MFMNATEAHRVLQLLISQRKALVEGEEILRVLVTADQTTRELEVKNKSLLDDNQKLEASAAVLSENVSAQQIQLTQLREDTAKQKQEALASINAELSEIRAAAERDMTEKMAVANSDLDAIEVDVEAANEELAKLKSQIAALEAQKATIRAQLASALG
jgi:chromosome segregation ATPase